MCLATVYKEEDNSVIFKNVSRIDVDGNKLIPVSYTHLTLPTIYSV